MNKLRQILFLFFIFCGSVFAQAPPVAVLSDMPTQDSMNAWKAKNIEIKERSDKVCADGAYKIYFAKTPCNVPEMTLQHLTDESKATPAEKKVMLLIDKEYSAIAQTAADNFRDNIKPAAQGIALANLRNKVRAEGQENLSNLYQGKISWGSYNTQRKALGASSKAEFDKIVKSYN